MNDFATTSDETFSADEQAAFDAMRAGSPPPAETAPEPAPRPEPTARTPENQPEPKAEPETEEPETGEDEGPEGEAEGNKGQYVRREALRQERERRKGLQKELAEAREARARLDERLRIFSEASQRAAPKPAEPQAEPEKVPNPEEDIFGYARHLQAKLDKLEGGLSQRDEQARQREAGEAVLSSYKQDAQRFAQAEPSFPEAYNHLYRSRAQELQYAGMTNPQEIMQAIARDEFEIAQQAIRDGVSPAQRIYEIAKARGFAPKAPEPTLEPKPVAETAAEKATRAQAGQNGPGRSLSSVGGKPAGSMPTVEELANMSEEDFNRFAKTNPGAVTALMGG
jgi:hypothetical protein